MVWRYKQVEPDYINRFENCFANSRKFTEKLISDWLRSIFFLAEPFLILKADFFIDRLLLFYFYHIYIPGSLLVALSWSSFWIPVTAVPARVTLIVTNFLSSLLVFNAVGHSIPKVSYQTPLELYALVNTVFIVFAMLEYIVVLKFPNFTTKASKVEVRSQTITVSRFLIPFPCNFSINTQMFVWYNISSNGFTCGDLHCSASYRIAYSSVCCIVP